MTVELCAKNNRLWRERAGSADKGEERSGFEKLGDGAGYRASYRAIVQTFWNNQNKMSVSEKIKNKIGEISLNIEKDRIFCENKKVNY